MVRGRDLQVPLTAKPAELWKECQMSVISNTRWIQLAGVTFKNSSLALFLQCVPPHNARSQVLGRFEKIVSANSLLALIQFHTPPAKMVTKASAEHPNEIVKFFTVMRERPVIRRKISYCTRVTYFRPRMFCEIVKAVDALVFQEPLAAGFFYVLC